MIKSIEEYGQFYLYNGDRIIPRQYGIDLTQRELEEIKKKLNLVEDTMCLVRKQKEKIVNYFLYDCFKEKKNDINIEGEIKIFLLKQQSGEVYYRFEFSSIKWE